MAETNDFNLMNWDYKRDWLGFYLDLHNGRVMPDYLNLNTRVVSVIFNYLNMVTCEKNQCWGLYMGSGKFDDLPKNTNDNRWVHGGWVSLREVSFQCQKTSECLRNSWKQTNLFVCGKNWINLEATILCMPAFQKKSEKRKAFES